LPDRDRSRMTIAEAIEVSRGTEPVPVTFERCDHVEGPFFHGTRVAFDPGDVLVPGHGSNYHDGRVSRHVYFSALLEPAVWGAELAVALTEGDGRPHLYVVEPTGPFEDDPNVTDKRFPGNPTRSYRTTEPLRVLEEVVGWEPAPPEMVRHIRERLGELAELGIEAID
jgi:hypothetical protein